jgi:signal transduction histidine kinase
VEKFTELVATAIANVETRSALDASRARIVAASDDARRRFERNLHDGVQQRLVSLSLAVRGAQTITPADLGDLHRQLSRVGENLADALEELRELSRGLHPAILSEGGLQPALRALARRSATPVKLELNVNQRLNEPIKANHEYLQLTIQDDGIGGADRDHGSGLIGLADRVEALGGTIAIASPTGHGTSIHVQLPITRNTPEPQPTQRGRYHSSTSADS